MKSCNPFFHRKMEYSTKNKTLHNIYTQYSYNNVTLICTQKKREKECVSVYCKYMYTVI